MGIGAIKRPVHELNAQDCQNTVSFLNLNIASFKLPYAILLNGFIPLY
jgi:hypothetical protein